MLKGPSSSKRHNNDSSSPAHGDDLRGVDVLALLRWSASMQANPIEGGGFRGRTNKLVDGCYSWWCGGLLPIAEYLLEEDKPAAATPDLVDLYDAGGSPNILFQEQDRSAPGD
jgi:prenyltransferase beta subunit